MTWEKAQVGLAQRAAGGTRCCESPACVLCLAQHGAQSRCSQALLSEWQPGWEQKPSSVSTVIGGERAPSKHSTYFTSALQVTRGRAGALLPNNKRAVGKPHNSAPEETRTPCFGEVRFASVTSCSSPSSLFMSSLPWITSPHSPSLPVCLRVAQAIQAPQPGPFVLVLDGDQPWRGGGGC